MKIIVTKKFVQKKTTHKRVATNDENRYICQQPPKSRNSVPVVAPISPTKARKLGTSNERLPLQKIVVLSVVIQRKLIRMGTQTQGVHLIIQLVLDPSIDEIFREHAASSQELVVLFQRLQRF